MNLLKVLRNEKGAVMTEFVICLPVFIIIFIGINNLFRIEQDGTRVKMRASTNMWDDAMGVMNGGGAWTHRLNFAASPLQMAGIASNPSNIGGDLRQTSIAGGLASGSSEEADAAGSVVGGAPAVPDTTFDFAGGMLDTQMSMLPIPSGPLIVWVGAAFFTLGQTRQAGIINERYGMVKRTHSIPNTIGGISYTMQAGYDTLVSPAFDGSDDGIGGRTAAEYRVIGASRLTAEESDCLSSVLELSADVDYDC